MCTDLAHQTRVKGSGCQPGKGEGPPSSRDASRPVSSPRCGPDSVCGDIRCQAWTFVGHILLSGRCATGNVSPHGSRPKLLNTQCFETRPRKDNGPMPGTASLRVGVARPCSVAIFFFHAFVTFDDTRPYFSRKLLTGV